MRAHRFAMPLVALAAFCSALMAADIAVPEDAPDLSAALLKAQPGDTIHLGPGEFAGDLTVDKPVTIRGAGRDETRIIGRATTLTINADVQLERLSIQGGENGVMVKAGRHLCARSCAFTDADSDGIGFESSTETTLELRGCLVTRNGDGVDLESTQGLAVDCEFIDNSDDGLDYDGDARFTCLGCRFADNRDDGVEIRLAASTEAVISRCEFSGNGEDGLEIINSPQEQPRGNVLVLGSNRFADNARWGVGFVTSYRPEECEEDDRTRAAVLWGPNEFSRNEKGAVSPNHVREMERAQPTDEEVTIRLTRAEGETQELTVPLSPAIPVATISLLPAISGGSAKDLEGIAILGTRLFLADDNTPGIHEIDLRTKGIARTLGTAPFPDSELTCRGTEGLCVVERDGRPALLLAADDESLIVTLDAAVENFGAVLNTRDVAGVTKQCEGIEQVGDKLWVAFGHRMIATLDPKDYAPTGATLAVSPLNYGSHIAGIGWDGRRVILTASAYSGRKLHTHRSLLIALDPQTSEPTEAWHIPYLDDPRGVACAGGLAYVADGMSPYTDEELGIESAGGIRVLVFALSPETSAALRLRDIPGPWFGKD